MTTYILWKDKLPGDSNEVFKWIKGISKGDLDEVLISKADVRTHNSDYKLKFIIQV